MSRDMGIRSRSHLYVKAKYTYCHIRYWELRFSWVTSCLYFSGSFIRTWKLSTSWYLSISLPEVLLSTWYLRQHLLNRLFTFFCLSFWTIPLSHATYHHLWIKCMHNSTTQLTSQVTTLDRHRNDNTINSDCLFTWTKKRIASHFL